MYTVFKVTDKSKILEEFLIEILKTEYSNKIINKYAKGTIRQILKFDDLCKILVPEITLDEQKDIISICNSYRSSINSAQNIINNYFPTINFDNYPIVPLGNLINSTEYGSSKKALDNGEIPVLRMGNIQSGEIDFDDLVYTNDAVEIKKLNLQNGDILFNRTNSPKLVGKSAIFRNQMKSIFAGYLIRIKVNKEKILPEYLNLFLNSSEGKKLHNHYKSVSGNQANINATKLREYKIPLPKLSEQQEIINEIKNEKDLIDGNKKIIKIFEKKIKTLFEKYLN
jgi:restriction endonuclease S subunit